jgi:hypothetical protein
VRLHFLPAGVLTRPFNFQTAADVP